MRVYFLDDNTSTYCQHYIMSNPFINLSARSAVTLVTFPGKITGYLKNVLAVSTKEIKVVKNERNSE